MKTLTSKLLLVVLLIFGSVSVSQAYQGFAYGGFGSGYKGTYYKVRCGYVPGHWTAKGYWVEGYKVCWKKHFKKCACGCPATRCGCYTVVKAVK